MNYHSAAELKGKILQLGDLVNFCEIGHSVLSDSFKNLGGCHGSWVFGELEIDDPKEFCEKFSNGGVNYYSFRDKFPIFSSEDFKSLTLVAIAIMERAESYGYGKKVKRGF